MGRLKQRKKHPRTVGQPEKTLASNYRKKWRRNLSQCHRPALQQDHRKLQIQKKHIEHQIDKQNSPWHIIIKTLKYRTRNIESCTRKTQTENKEMQIGITADFSNETLKVRRDWSS